MKNITIFLFQFTLGMLVIAIGDVPEIGLGFIIFGGFIYLGEVIKQGR